MREETGHYLQYSTKTELRLPFDDEWFVAWGGRTLKDNKHAVTTDQRFAMDLIILEPGRSWTKNLHKSFFSGKVKSHKADGTENEHYFCFGKSILSLGKGVVVLVRSNIPDNDPGKMNESEPTRNFVVIDHGNGEYSFLAHFKKNSIIVTENQRVQAGQFIGQCGNSGRFTEPHLHYHLQNSKIWGKGEGLPTQFTSDWADGKLYRREEPTAGQLIKNP